MSVKEQDDNVNSYKTQIISPLSCLNFIFREKMRVRIVVWSLAGTFGSHLARLRSLRENSLLAFESSSKLPQCRVWEATPADH